MSYLKQDFHIHTWHSDAKNSLPSTFNEALENNFYRIGLVDHCSPADNDLKRRGRFWNQVDDIDDYTEKWVTRNKLLKDYIDKEEERIHHSAREKTPDELVQEFSKNFPDLEITEEKFLGIIGPEVYIGAEIDYNPRIENAENTKEYRQIVEEFEEELTEFIQEVNQSEYGFDFITGSTHYYNLNGKPLYVKNEELFQDLSLAERKDSVEAYFERLGLLIDSEIFDIVAHPTLIERNSILMDSLNNHEEELTKHYTEIIKKLKSSRTVPEINGKGVERQDFSIFWKLLETEDVDYLWGSDAHRENEMSERSILKDKNGFESAKTSINESSEPEEKLRV